MSTFTNLNWTDIVLYNLRNILMEKIFFLVVNTMHMELHMQYAKKNELENGNTYLKESIIIILQPKALAMFIDNRLIFHN